MIQTYGGSRRTRNRAGRFVAPPCIKIRSLYGQKCPYRSRRKLTQKAQRQVRPGVAELTLAIINIEAFCAAPPEALAHSPSQMPLSCPVAPPSQRELHKDGGGGGGGVARRARAARAPKAKSCATSSETPSAMSCVTSLTCWRRRRRRWWWCGRGVKCVVVVAHRWPQLHAPGGRRGGPP